MANADAANAAVPFMLLPGGGDEVLDLSGDSGRKFFFRATEGLTELFDGTASHLKTFLQDLKARASIFGWTKVLTLVADEEEYYLPDQYGQVTLEQVQDNAEPYLNEPVHDA